MRPPLPEELLDPHPARLDPSAPDRDAIVARHRAAVDAGIGGYTDPRSGLFVLTAAELWARGACCGNGCRHCPYLARP